MQYYYLETIKGSCTGQRYLIPEGATSIGRKSENTIPLPSEEKCVSGHHAVIYNSSDNLILHDFQSTNGTFVNETRIEETELAEGDVIGFGQGGPRLRVVFSNKELDTSPVQGSTSLPGVFTSIKTQQGQASSLFEDDVEATMFDHKDNSENSLFEDETMKPSLTCEIERKLIDKRISANDMQTLMKDGKRIEKIAQRGKVGQTQVNMLRSTITAHRIVRKQWYYYIAVLVFISLVVSSYFAIRAFQYKNIVTRARLIKQDLDKYEKRIAELKKDPRAKNKEELKALIAQIEEKEKSLSSLKGKMNKDDFGKFYSDPLEQRIDKILRRFGETEYHIPKEMTERVKHHIECYSGRLHSSIAKYLERKDTYFPMIYRIFREKNLPLDLAYVSMLESGFNPKIRSHAGARGLWQFMPGTGRQYGLKVNKTIDERTNPEKATYAAAEYFKDLIGIFGGKSAVMLCMAAYNAGEGRVMGALRKIDDPMRNRDFWYIYRMGYLADETNEYIPRVIAMIIIAEHPAEYGFHNVAPANYEYKGRE